MKNLKLILVVLGALVLTPAAYGVEKGAREGYDLPAARRAQSLGGAQKLPTVKKANPVSTSAQTPKGKSAQAQKRQAAQAKKQARQQSSMVGREESGKSLLNERAVPLKEERSTAHRKLPTVKRTSAATNDDAEELLDEGVDAQEEEEQENE